MSKLTDVIFDRCHTNTIKGIAILLVMLGHIGIIPHAGAYGVELFLMLSGFGLVQSYFNSGLGNFFSKRLSKVIIPYAIITIIWILIFGHPAILNGDYYQLVLVVLGLDVKTTVDPSMWYIPYIIIWYIVFYLIFSANISNNKKILFLFLFSIYLYKNANIFPLPTGAGLYVTAFPIGAAIGMIYYMLREHTINRRYLSMCFFIFAVVSFCSSVYFYQGINFSFFDYAATDITCALFVIGVTSLFNISKIHLSIFEFFGKISYEMYLIEFMFLMKCLWIQNLFSAEYMKAAVFIATVTIFAYLFKLLLSLTTNKISVILKSIEPD